MDAALGRITTVDRAGIVVVAVDRRMETTTGRIATIGRAGVSVITDDWRIDAAGCRIARIRSTGVPIVAGDWGAHAGPGRVAGVVFGAGIPVITGTAFDRREHALTASTGVIGTGIAIVANDRRVNALSCNAGVLGARIAVVATDEAAAAIRRVVLEVGVDYIAVRLVRWDRSGADRNQDDWIVGRAGHVANLDRIVGETAAPGDGKRATERTSQQAFDQAAAGGAARKRAREIIEPLAIHGAVAFRNEGGE